MNKLLSVHKYNFIIYGFRVSNTFYGSEDFELGTLSLRILETMMNSSFDLLLSGHNELMSI